VRDEDGGAGVNGGNRCHGHCVLGTSDEGKGVNGVGRVGRSKRDVDVRQWCCRPKCLVIRIHGTGRWRGVGSMNWRGVER